MPYTTLNTPAGTPASVATSARIRAVSGAFSDGLRTTVLPASSAGASLETTCWSGKFHGVIAPTTPIGSRTISEVPISSVQAKSSARPATDSMTAAGKATWAVRDMVIGEPISAVIAPAISSWRAVRPAPRRRSTSARCCGVVAAQAGKAARAAATARSTSVAVPAGASATTSPVAGFTTGRAPAEPATISPPIQ